MFSNISHRIKGRFTFKIDKMIDVEMHVLHRSIYNPPLLNART
jgi:hypothetical protein